MSRPGSRPAQMVSDSSSQRSRPARARRGRRPEITETTALGAAYAAGLAVGFWTGLPELAANWAEDTRWVPQRDAAWRDREYSRWKKAVTRSLDWVD